MEAKESNHVIKISDREAYDIAVWIYRSLKQSIQTHWVNYPLVWKDHEENTIKSLKFFYELANYPHLFTHSMNEFEKIIEEAKKKQAA